MNESEHVLFTFGGDLPKLKVACRVKLRRADGEEELAAVRGGGGITVPALDRTEVPERANAGGMALSSMTSAVAAKLVFARTGGAVSSIAVPFSIVWDPIRLAPTHAQVVHASRALERSQAKSQY